MASRQERGNELMRQITEESSDFIEASNEDDRHHKATLYINKTIAYNGNSNTKGSAAQKIAFYKSQIAVMKKQLIDVYAIDRIIDLENEVKVKQKQLEEHEGKSTQITYNENPDTFKAKIELYKEELKEKQKIIGNQEKVIREKRKELMSLEEKCEMLKNVIISKKAAKIHTSINADENANGQAEELEDEKRKYKQMVVAQENKVKSLRLAIDQINIELKQKDHEARLNLLKINELKRKLKLLLNPSEAPVKSETPFGHSKVVIKKIPPLVQKEVIYNFEQFRRDMLAERGHSLHKNEKKQPVPDVETKQESPDLQKPLEVESE